MEAAHVVVLILLSNGCAMHAMGSLRSISPLRGGRVFAFGDSYADTGNRVPRDTSFTDSPWRPPYGETWPGCPFGRFSDGRILTDFFVRALNVPLPTPYRVYHQQSRTAADGINFAFAGSGVFPTLNSKEPTVDAQIDQLVNATVSMELITASTILLVVVGNDYVVFTQNHPNDVVGIEAFIPKVVSAIASAIQRLIGLGFTRFAVAKVATFGCYPNATSSTNYTSCAQSQNVISSEHNVQLETAIVGLQGLHPTTKFFLLDLEAAFAELLEGLRPSYGLKPCCVPEANATCGDVDSLGRPKYTLCASPQNYFFWDEFHPTNKAWANITNIVFSS